jgi:hypothetical protein
MDGMCRIIKGWKVDGVDCLSASPLTNSNVDSSFQSLSKPKSLANSTSPPKQIRKNIPQLNLVAGEKYLPVDSMQDDLETRKSISKQCMQDI